MPFDVGSPWEAASGIVLRMGPLIPGYRPLKQPVRTTTALLFLVYVIGNGMASVIIITIAIVIGIAIISNITIIIITLTLIVSMLVIIMA